MVSSDRVPRLWGVLRGYAGVSGMLTNKKLCELLDYDPETGLFCWRVTRGFLKRGTPAGGMFQGGVAITIEGKRYTGHALAWQFNKGRWPTTRIRHLNGDRMDNRAVNLTTHMLRTTAANERIDLGFEVTRYGYRIVDFTSGVAADLGTWATIDEVLEVICSKSTAET